MTTTTKLQALADRQKKVHDTWIDRAGIPAKIQIPITVDSEGKATNNTLAPFGTSINRLELDKSVRQTTEYEPFKAIKLRFEDNSLNEYLKSNLVEEFERIIALNDSNVEDNVNLNQNIFGPLYSYILCDGIYNGSKITIDGTKMRFIVVQRERKGTHSNIYRYKLNKD